MVWNGQLRTMDLQVWEALRTAWGPTDDPENLPAREIPLARVAKREDWNIFLHATGA